MVGLLLLSLLAPMDDRPAARPAARPCTPQEVRDLTTPSDRPYRLLCRAVLAGANVSRPVLIEGAEASGAGLDCGGGTIRRPG